MPKKSCFPLWRHGKGLSRAGAAGTLPALACVCAQQRRAGVRLPSRHGIVDYLQLFLRRQDFSRSLSADKPGTEYVLTSLVVFRDSG